MTGERVLVIKLSALGDFIQATGAMKAIRAAHPDARITLLTTAPYAKMGQATGWFDEVWDDGRPSWGDLPAVAKLLGRLRGARFDRVYDLQTQSRTNRYFQLLWPRRPVWSGNARGAAFSYRPADRGQQHIQDLLRNQLSQAGVTISAPDLSWLSGDATRFQLPAPYALLVPGGAPHRPAKRWPAPLFGEVARRLTAQGVTPIVLGHGDQEAALAQAIAAVEPMTLSLVGQTSLGDIASLARGAALALGNDTGPIHVVASSGCSTLVLFSNDSDPALSAPRPVKAVQAVEILREADLADLSVERVWAALSVLHPVREV